MFHHRIATYHRQVVARIRALAPGVPPARQQRLALRPRKAAKVREFHAAVRRITGQADARYVDLRQVLADHRSGLRSQYTHDDLHLNGPGYRAWVQTLRPLLADVARRATKENSP